MKITETKIKVSDLVANYSDNGDGGVFGYDGRLTIRPSYQREFVFSDKQRAAVIDSVMNGFPLNLMYWSKTGPDTYEVLDGQQRTISIAQYVSKDFPVKINGNDKFFQNLTDEEKQTILDYELMLFETGTDELSKCTSLKMLKLIDRESQNNRNTRKNEMHKLFSYIDNNSIIGLIGYREYIMTGTILLDTKKYKRDFCDNEAVAYLCDLQDKIIAPWKARMYSIKTALTNLVFCANLI